jgi:heat shock protein HtpX
MGSMFKTMFGLTLMTLLVVFVGHLVGGPQGMAMALVVAGVMNFFMYFFSDRIVLKMYGATELDPAEAPTIHRIVEELAAKAGIPKPKVYGIAQETPNAFATGRNPSHAVVAVTHGLLRLIDERELRGVIAHELGHVINRDMLLSTLIATMAGAITFVADMIRWTAILGSDRDGDGERDSGWGALLLAILLPIVAAVVQMFISRQREFAADRTGAELSGDPLSLASALGRLEASARAVPLQASPATAHMFIVNPLTGGGLMSLFSTHPSTQERVDHLQEIARELGQMA